MPKIMFRPNPTPPPFVPPGPVYDTVFSAFTPDSYYDPEEPLSIKFSPAQCPDFNYFKLQVNQTVIARGGSDDFYDNAFNAIETYQDISIPLQCQIVFFKYNPGSEDDEVWSGNLTVTMA